MRFSTSFLNIVALAGITAVAASPLTARDILNVGINSPNANTVWTVGSAVDVNFNISIVKNENGTLKDIQLYSQNNALVTTLATDFPSTTGSARVTVPQVADGTYYVQIDSYRPVSWSSANFTIEN